MKLNRLWLLVGLVVSLRASAIPSGSLLITDHAMDPKSPTFERDLRRAAKTALPRVGDGWHLYFVAYLKRSPGAPELNLVFYETQGGKREQVNVFPIQTQESAKVLMSEAEISPENGFKVGGKYQVLLTRLIGGKEEVYARTTLELKK